MKMMMTMIVIGLLAGIGLLVVLWLAARKTRLRALIRLSNLAEENSTLVEQLKAAKQRVQIEVKPLADDQLMSYLSAGPESSVWKGVEGCVQRVIGRFCDGFVQTTEEKVAAMDGIKTLNELLAEMHTWYRKAAKQAGK